MSYQTNGIVPGRDDDRKLFVGGIGRNITDKELGEYFGKYGEVESITIKNDPFTGQSRGFAFVVFSNSKTIDDLLAVGDHYIGNKKVDPKKVIKKQQPLKCKIFVGGLTPEITDVDVKDYFNKYGNIIEFQAPFDKIKNQRKGFCFITFDSKDVVNDILKSPKQVIKGKEVDVKKVKFNPETMGTTAQRGRGGGMYGVRGAYSGAYGMGPTTYGQTYGAEYGSGYDSYGYGGYDYSMGSYGGGYGGYAQGPTAYGGGKFRENQYQRHQPY